MFFNLLIDESNDHGIEAKDAIILVKFFDPVIMKEITRFLDLPTANDGTAATIFHKIHGCLEFNGSIIIEWYASVLIFIILFFDMFVQTF